MGCTQTTENDRNLATASLNFNQTQIETKKALEFSLGPTLSLAYSKVELSVSCRKLKNKDKLSETDPFYVAYEKHVNSNDFIEICRSEIISNTLNPFWIKKVTLTYNFEKSQQIKIEVYDCVSSFTSSCTKDFKLSEHNLLGHCTFSLGDIFGASHRGWFGPLKNDRDEEKKGYMTIQGEELSSISDKLHIRLECDKLKNMELFSKSDPFLIISKERDDQSFSTCYKSEVMSNNLSPAYEIKSSTLELANGDLDRTLKIEVYDWNMNGHHVYIGETVCTINSLLQEIQSQQNGNEPNPLLVIDGKDDPTVKEKLMRRQSDGTIKTRGRIYVKTCTITHTPSFLDYIKSGAQLQLMVGIDFTLSNGLPLTKDSLHFVDPNDRSSLNSYAQAIISVCEILGPYCGGSNKMICPVFGFGGQLTPDTPVNHCFSLSSGNEQYGVHGIHGVISAYYSNLSKITLSGPTHFSKVINKAIELTNAEMKKRQTYTVLLILTDGCIKDMSATIDSIVKASSLPMSILIVGIGNENFGEMHELDSDNKVLKDRNGNVAERDIVQFTELNKLIDTGSRQLVRLSLAESILEELPQQFLDYQLKNNILPQLNQSNSNKILNSGGGGDTESKSNNDPDSDSDSDQSTKSTPNQQIGTIQSQKSRYFDVFDNFTSDAFFIKKSIDIMPSKSNDQVLASYSSLSDSPNKNNIDQLPKLTVLTSEPSNQSTLSSQQSNQVIHLSLQDVTIISGPDTISPGSDSIYSLQVHKSQSSTMKFPEADP